MTDAELLPNIFDLFTQADESLDRTERGLGIGLALVKKIVEMHEGSVEAYSDGAGRGSEFVVRLPIASGTAEQEPGDAEATGEETQPRRVLVVDDNVDTTTTTAMLLRSWGHEVQTAHNGPDALQRAAAFQPQVVLLDIGLPDMNGYDVARRLRRDSQIPNVRLIAISGYGRDEDRKRSKDAGFDVHLIKPVEVSVLENLLAEIPTTTG